MWELGKMGVKIAAIPPRPGQPYEGAEAVVKIASGLKEMGAAAIGQRGPEAMGEAHGGALLGMIPAGRVAAAVARRGVPILGGATEASRAYNVKRALRVPPRGTTAPELSLAARIETMAPEIDMPIVASPHKLAQRMTAVREAAGEAVGAAEAALPTSDIPITNVLSRIEPPPGQWAMRNGVLEYVPDDPAAMNAYRASQRRLVEPAGDTGVVTSQEALRLKRSGQTKAAEGRAYTSERAGQQAQAAETRAQALRAELEALPGPESERFTRANRRFEVAKTAEEPIVAEAGRLSDMPVAGRGVEMLLGRAIPGSGFARQALGGLAGGALLDSTLFHTASAAIKRKVIDALKSGNAQLATDILFKAGVAKSTLDRRAAAALAAQGEGVIAP
jgi:hypothetical protein